MSEKINALILVIHSLCVASSNHILICVRVLEADLPHKYSNSKTCKHIILTTF